MPLYKFFKQKTMNDPVPMMLNLNGENYFDLKNAEQVKGFAKAIKLYTGEEYTPICKRKKKSS